MQTCAGVVSRVSVVCHLCVVCRACVVGCCSGGRFGVLSLASVQSRQWPREPPPRHPVPDNARLGERRSTPSAVQFTFSPPGQFRVRGYRKKNYIFTSELSCVVLFFPFPHVLTFFPPVYKSLPTIRIVREQIPYSGATRPAAKSKYKTRPPD